MIAGSIVAAIGAFAFAAAAVLQALGAARVSRSATTIEERRYSDKSHPSLRSTGATMITGPFLIGFGFDVIGFVATIASARMIPLFLSQTIISARLVATALLAMVVMKIHLTLRDWIAVLVVVVSLVVLAVLAGKGGGDHGRGMALGGVAGGFSGRARGCCCPESSRCAGCTAISRRPPA